MKRKLKNGGEAEQLDQPVALIIWTLVPDKWEITDLETGQVYRGNKEKHPTYGDMLQERVAKGNIGQWKKNVR